VYFAGVTAERSCRQRDVGLDQLTTDIKNAKNAPALAYISPDACDNGSDTPCAQHAEAGLKPANAFLKKVVSEIKRSPAYKDNGLIAITFDQAPQTGPHADPSACCNTPNYPNLAGGATTSPAAAAASFTPPSDADPGPPAGTTIPTTTTTATTTSTDTTTASLPTTSTTVTTTGTSSLGATTSTAATPPPTTVPPTTTTTTTTTSTAPTSGSTGQTTPTGGGGQVGLLLISPYVKPGTSDLVDYYNHFSLLATIENLFGVKRLGYASDLSLPVFDAAIFNAKP